MATLYIREFQRLAEDGNGNVVLAGKEPGTDQTVTFTTSTASTEFLDSTKFVALYSDADCHFVFGVSPTATTSHMRLKADVMLFLGVTQGQKVAAVTV